MRTPYPLLIAIGLSLLLLAPLTAVSAPLASFDSDSIAPTIVPRTTPMPMGDEAEATAEAPLSRSLAAPQPPADKGSNDAIASAPDDFSCADVTEIPLSECEALVALYNSTDGDNWENNDGWLVTNTPCSWHGVVACSDGHVSELNLSNNQLSGAIPPELDGLTNLTVLWLGNNQLTGAIPSELGDLTNLTMLWLYSNQLDGDIPDLSALTSLTSLDLSDNQLTGAIPPELGALTNLTRAFLNKNQLTGSIPPELSNLLNLTWLSLSENQLSGAIPPELGALTNLTHLRLYSNQLSGPIPVELGNLANLQLLILHSNQLTGAIPSELGALTNLTHVYLYGNQLEGVIPPQLSDLTSLVELWLHDNRLSGAIPPELDARLVNLQSLNLSENQLSDAIPSELGGLASLTVLSLGGNQLSGAIPPELSNLASLAELYLNDNQLAGGIPSELDALASLTVLDLGDNQLTGAIPSQLGGLVNLTELRLDYNQLSGAIPSQLDGLTSLTVLDLSDNQLSGFIPPELGALDNLIDLRLRNNQLSGAIPPELDGLTNLTVLWLGNNQLAGAIPSELGDLTNLTMLWLYSNQLDGDIPDLSALTSLTSLDLSDNQLTGAIPPELGSLTNLTALWLNRNQLEGVIPDLRSLASLTALNLAENQLTGAIPSQLGTLTNLTHLWLHKNQLSGSIPPELGSLTNLQRLSLHSNLLTGAIPAGLGGLTNLQYLWLDNNQLSGSVPDELCGLDNLVDASLAYNALTGDPACLDGLLLAWQETQTAPPCNVAAVVQDSRSIRLTWTPIPYTADGGYYEILHATHPAGPYTLHETADKLAQDYRVTGLTPGQTHYFRLRTFTPAHGDQQNDLRSAYSLPVLASTHTLRLSKAASVTQAQSGDTLAYTLVLATTIDSTVTATLADTLPVNLAYVPGSATGGAVYEGGQIRYTGDVAPDSIVTLTYQAMVADSVASGTLLRNTAVVTGAGYLAEQSANVVVPNTVFTGTLILIYASGDSHSFTLWTAMLGLLNKVEAALEAAGNPPDIKVVMVLDGPKEDDSYLYYPQPDSDDSCPSYSSDNDPGDDDPTCGRYVWGQTIYDWREDVGGPDSLSSFLTTIVRAYPAANQVLLSLVGHGNGLSLDKPHGYEEQPGGLLRDEHPGVSLSTADLGKALQQAFQARGQKIDLLYLDACFMAMAEVAYQVHESVGYLLASENRSWAAFPYGEHIADVQSGMSTLDIGEAWLRNEVEILWTQPTTYPFTLSLIDLNQMEELRAAFHGLTTALMAELPEGKPALLEATSRTLAVGGCFDDFDDRNFDDDDGLIDQLDSYCDLASFAWQLQQFADNQTVKDAAQAVIDAVAAAVIVERHQSGAPWIYPNQFWDWDENLGGVSIYLPLDVDDWKRKYYTVADVLWAGESGWGEFLNEYWENDEPPAPPYYWAISPAPLPL